MYLSQCRIPNDAPQWHLGRTPRLRRHLPIQRGLHRQHRFKFRKVTDTTALGTNIKRSSLLRALYSNIACWGAGTVTSLAFPETASLTHKPKTCWPEPDDYKSSTGPPRYYKLETNKQDGRLQPLRSSQTIPRRGVCCFLAAKRWRIFSTDAIWPVVDRGAKKSPPIDL